jgi:hypothetical protein
MSVLSRVITKPRPGNFVSATTAPTGRPITQEITSPMKETFSDRKMISRSSRLRLKMR